MFQESRTDTASPLGPHFNTAVSYHYSVPKAIAAEDTILIQEWPENCYSSSVVFPKLLFISDGRKTGISMAL